MKPGLSVQGEKRLSVSKCTSAVTTTRLNLLCTFTSILPPSPQLPTPFLSKNSRLKLRSGQNRAGRKQAPNFAGFESLSLLEITPPVAL